MTKNRICVKINDQKFWVVSDNGRLIRNPIKEDLMGTKLISYSPTNICPECRKENNITDNSILYPGNARRKTDEKGNKIEEWLCGRHGNNSYDKNNPNSRRNLQKLLASRRTGYLTEPRHLLGDKCQKLTCIWLGVEDLNQKLDKFNLPIDHSPIPDGVYIEIGGKLIDLYGKIPQTKGSNFLIYRWQIACPDRETDKKFDIMILYCISEDGKKIERIYIFPKDVILNKAISIGKNHKYKNQWYNSYIVTDKKELDNVNKIWRIIE